MKIAYDYQTFTMQAYGGISRYYVRLAEQLNQRGEDIKIFAPFHCNQLVDSLPKSLIDGKRISVKKFPKALALGLMATNQILAKKTIGKWSPDLVHETYFAMRRSGPKKCPVVITVYDMIHEKFSQNFHKADPTSFLKRKAITRADHIICISESTKKDLIEFFPSVENKISVVHLGFSAYKPEEKEVFHDRPYLLYVGTRNGHKNFLNFLQSFAEAKRLRSNFDLVAFGGGAFTSTELNAITNLKFQPSQVRHVSGNDHVLAMYYKRAATFVYPSYYEGFGLPPLEAMTQNCAVVSSNTSSMPEVIGEAGEYFDPNSKEQISNAIEKVVFSQSRRDELIQLGKKRIELFTWQNCASHTQQIYSQVINRFEQHKIVS